MSLKKNCVRCIGYNKNEKSRTFKRKLFLGTSFSHFKASRQQVKTRNVDLWPTLQPATVGFFIVLLIQCNTHCDTIPRFSLSRPKDLWLSPLMAAFWRRKNRHYLFFRTCSVGCIFHISFCHDKCGFLLGFFHGQIVWNLFIVGKLVEKKAASEMISYIAFFPSNLIPVPGLLFNAHMKC